MTNVSDRSFLQINVEDSGSWFFGVVVGKLCVRDQTDTGLNRIRAAILTHACTTDAFSPGS